jgi:hypothetical protein
VVRAGAGIMYDRIYNNVFENIRFNPPYYSDNQIGGPINGVPVGAVSSPGLLSFPFTSQAAFNSPEFAPLPNPRHMNQNIVTPYYEQVHFGLQWGFGKGFVFEPEYVGTFGHKLLGLNEINTFDGRTATGLDQTRINPNIGQDNFRYNGFASNYHGLQLSLRKAYASGLNLNANYTYSKSLDDSSDLFNSRVGKYQTDTMNAHYDYGPSDFDVRHRFVATIGYELPFMKQNRWIGGWGVDSIISYQTGHPFAPYSSSSHYDLNKDGNRTDRLIPVGSPSSTLLSSSPANGFFDTTKWVRATCPADVNEGLWCNPAIGRNALFGPHFANVDLSLRKKFKLNERSSFTFQAAFFDLANHPNFFVPTYNQSSGTFGKSVQTAGDSGGHRITQLSARFDF